MIIAQSQCNLYNSILYTLIIIIIIIKQISYRICCSQKPNIPTQPPLTPVPLNAKC